MYFDIVIFNFINGLAGRWQWLDLTGIFFAKYFEYFLWFFLIVLLFKDFKKYWRMVAEAVIAALFVRFVLVKIFYALFFRLRPFVYPDNANLLVYHNSGATSFPSGHASFYFALSTIIYGYNKKWGMLFYIGSLLIVLSRIFVGMHWPSDVMAGAMLGVVIGLVLNKLFKKVVLTKKEYV